MERYTHTIGNVLENAEWMRYALELARKGIGLTAPNPPVGAVIVLDGRIIAKGYHGMSGRAHAEIHALREAYRKAYGLEEATMYVTLEPCSTHGKTPPCTDAIIKAKVGRVVVGCLDENPAHAGKGIKLLRAAGVQVVQKTLESECHDLVKPFFKFVKTKRPWVVAKLAMSMDGRIGRAAKGASPLISGELSREQGQIMRMHSDAILIGGRTAVADDPSLTIRGLPRLGRKTQPWRVIFSRGHELPKNLHLFTDEHRDRTIVTGPAEWDTLLKRLGSMNVMQLLIEGGGETIASAFQAGVVDEIAYFVAPSIIGDGPAAFPGFKLLGKEFRVDRLRAEPIGNDLLVRGYVHRTR